MVSLTAWGELSNRLRTAPLAIAVPTPVRSRRDVVVRVRIPRFWRRPSARGGTSSGLITAINSRVYSLICQ